MRLFVAIDLDDDARRAIVAEQKRLLEVAGSHSRSPLRGVRPEEMHLTLEFVGEVDAVHAQPLVEAFGRDVDAAPFTVVCAGLGVFPPRGAPKVLWIGIVAGRDEVVALRSRVVDRLTRVGIACDVRPYHPHLTLARWRVSRPADRDRVLAADHGTPIARIDVGAVTLYRSDLSSVAARHTVLARATLRT